MRIRFSKQASYPIQSKQGRLITNILLLAGLIILLAGGYQSWKYAQVKDELVCVQARIDQIEVSHYRNSKGKQRTRHEVYVSYTYDGRDYEDIHLGWYSSSMREGRSLELKIHPDDPSRPVANHGPILLLGGSFFLLLTGAFWCAARWDRLWTRFVRKKTEPFG